MRRARLSAVGRLLAPRSLRYQLLSRSLFVLAGLLVLIAVFQYVLMHEFLFRNNADSIHKQILSVPPDIWMMQSGEGDANRNGFGGSGDFGHGKRSPGDMERDRQRILNTPDTSVAFIGPDGIYKLLTDQQTDTDNDEAIQLSSGIYRSVLAKGNWDSIVQKNSRGKELLVVLQPISGHDGAQGIIQMSVETAPLYDVLIQQLLIFLSLACLALVLGIATFLPVLRRTLDPLSRMVHTVEQIDAGNLTVRLKEKQKQLEIDRLAASFNGMLQRLETSFEAEKEAKEQMRRFVADASHELRTPLTSIHGFLEVLLRGAVHNSEQLNRALTSMHGESERIIKLVQDLLTLAKLDRTPALEWEHGELGGVIREMEPQLHVLAGTRKLVIDTPDCAAIKFDRDKMKQVILNLFHNAVQHTDPQEGRITVRVTPSETARGITLTIGDNGPGIAREHLPHLLERFYRVDASRNRKLGGAGLGLAITKSIVDIHGGWIDVESSEGEGTRFHVQLPRPEALLPEEDA